MTEGGGGCSAPDAGGGWYPWLLLGVSARASVGRSPTIEPSDSGVCVVLGHLARPLLLITGGETSHTVRTPAVPLSSSPTFTRARLLWYLGSGTGLSPSSR